MLERAIEIWARFHSFFIMEGPPTYSEENQGSHLTHQFNASNFDKDSILYDHIIMGVARDYVPNIFADSVLDQSSEWSCHNIGKLN
jgi:hypothetical protein